MNRKYLPFLFLLGLLPTLAACDDPKENPLPLLEDPLRTGRIDFGGTGRIYYEITGPGWDTPNVAVGDTLVVMGEARVDGDRVLPAQNHLAAYASDATPLVTFQPEWVGEGSPPAGTYEFDGVLVDAAGTRTPFLHTQGELASLAGDYAPIQVAAAALPHDTARLYTLEITHTYVTGGVITRRVTQTEFAQTWKAPLPNTKLYQQIIR